jgi:hypothetical protein
MAVSKHWCQIEIDTSKHKDLDLVFTNHGEEGEIYPLTTIKIAKAQQKDQELKVNYKQNTKTLKEDTHFQLIEDTKVICKNDKLITPASLRRRAVSWYHHYLQHPGHSCLKETMRSMMYRKGVVHAYVDQKLLKSNKIMSFNRQPKHVSEHCSNEYKRNSITTLAIAILSVGPPPINYILTLVKTLVKPFCFD